MAWRCAAAAASVGFSAMFTPEAGRGNVLFKLHKCRRQACALRTVCWMQRINARSGKLRPLGVAHAHTLVGLRPACPHVQPSARVLGATA